MSLPTLNFRSVSVLRKGVALFATVVTAFLAAVLAPSTASAIDYTWTSATTGGLWSGTTNWTPTAALATGPSTGDTVTLNSTASGTYRTVSIDSGASTGVGTLTLVQTNSGTNELSINRNFSVTNAITLGASNGGIARIVITPTTAASLTSTFTGGITLNAGGALVLGAFSGTTTTTRTGDLTGNVLVQGGSLIVDQVAKGSPAGSTGSVQNTITGTLTMTSGSFTILNSSTNSTSVDRRIQISAVNVTGGTFTATNGSAVFAISGANTSSTFSPQSFSTSNYTLSLLAGGSQSLALGVQAQLLLRAWGVKTISTTFSGTSVTLLNMVDGDTTTANRGTTLRLGSNLSSTAFPSISNLSVPEASTNRLDLGIDANGNTLDLSPNAGVFTPNAVTVSTTNTQVFWALTSSAGAGTIVANGFNFNFSASGTGSVGGSTNNAYVSVGPNVVLESRAGSGTANTLSTGTTGITIDPTSIFRYSGTATVANPSTLTSTRSIGDVEVTSGALRISSLTGLQAVRVSGGTLDLGNNSLTVTSGSFGGNVTSGTLTSGTFLASSGTVSAVLSGTGGLTKSGAGTFTLSGASTYSGATLVNSGSFVIGVADALSGSTAVTVAGGVLDLGAFNDTVASFALTSGSLIGSGGKLTAATYALGGGTVGANLGSGTVTVSANSALNGTSDATALNLNAGGLTLGSAGRFTQPTVAVSGSSGASLTLGGNETIGSLAGAANVALGGATLTTGSANTSTTYSGALSGGGGLTKVGAGTFTLAGVNGYTGPTTVSGGTLAIGANASIAGSAVTVGNAAALAGSGTAGATTVLSGGILAPGVAGAGTLRLATLTFGTTAGDTATVSIPTTGLSTIPATLAVTGGVSTNGGNGSVTFAFGSLALVPTGTYSLMAFSGSLASGTSPFTYTGSLSSRQSAALADGGSSLNLVLSSAFPIWSGSDGSGWSTTNNWTLSSNGSPTTFQADDTVVFNDAGATGTVTISGSNVNPAATTFSGDTLAYTLNATGGFGISTGSLIKSGSATLTIANANSYNGGTTVSAGTLRVGDDAALGSGAVALNGGVLSSESATARSLANAISVGGNVTLGDATNNGNLTLAGPVDLGGGTRTLSIASPVTLSGAVTSGGLTKDGSATLVLTGSNTYTGATTVNAGTLQVGSGGSTGSLATASAITGSAGATLAFNRSDAVTVSNGITGGLGVSQIGGGTATIAGSNTYTGPTTVSNGVLSLGSAASLPSQTAVSVAGGGLNLNGATATAGSFAITSGSLFGSGKLTAATYALGGGTVAGNLGSGTLTVTANSSLAGTSDATAVNLNAGGLTLGSAGRFTQPTVAVSGSSGGSLTLGGNETIGSLAGAANVALGSATLTTGSANTSTTYSGALSGNGGFTKVGSGTWTLSGANAQTGPLALNGGFVQLSSAGALGSSGTISFGGGGIIYTSSNTTDYSSRFSTANDQQFSVNMNGQTATWATSLTSGSTASLTRSGAGMLTLTGTATSLGTGGITLNGGTTVINPGAAGTFSSTGRFAIGNVSGTSAVTIQSGSVNITPTSSFAYMSIADGGSGALTISGGTTTLGLANTRLFVGNKAAGSLTVSGGLLQLTGGNPIYIGGDQSFTNNNANGTLTISGGTVSIPSAGTFSIGNSGSAGNTFTGVSGTLNLNGGELQTARAITTSTLGSSPATSTVNFNGGTLTPLAASTTFLQGLTAANVQNGGAVINTNGFDITIAQNLLGTGTGGLSKTGGGKLTLSGTNTYTGNTVLTGTGSMAITNASALGSGTLVLNTSYSAGPNSIFDISGSGTITNPISMNVSSGRNNFTVVSGSTVLQGPITLVGTGNNTQTIYSSGAGLEIRGNITGTGANQNLSFRGTGVMGVISGTVTLPTATIDLNGGGHVNWLVTSTGNVWGTSSVNATGSFVVGANNALPTTARVSWGGAVATGGVDLNGFVQTVAGLDTTSVVGSGTGLVTNNSATSDSTLTLAFASGTTYEYRGVIADGTNGRKLAVVMNSPGATQIISGTSTATGVTTITSGTLQVGNAGTTGAVTGPIVNNATLVYNRSNTTTAASNISGSGLVVHSGGSQLTLSGSNTYTGGTLVNGAGMLVVNGANQVGSGTITLRTTGTSTLTVLSLNGVTLANPLVLDQVANNRNNITGTNATVLAGPITITGSGNGQNVFTVNPASTMTISGNITSGSNYTGSPSFRPGSGATLAITGTVNFASSGFDLNGGSGTVLVSSTGNVWSATIFQASSVVLRLGANNALPTTATGTFSGNTSGGGIDLNGFSQAMPGFSSNSGSIPAPLARIYNDAATDSTLTLAGLAANRSAAIALADGTGGGRLALVMNSAGRTQTLTSATSNYSGGTTIVAGTVALGAANALGSTSGALAVNGGGVDLRGFALAVGTLSGSSGGRITSGTAGAVTFTASSAANSTFGGIIENGLGTVSFVKGGSGRLELTGANTFTGATNVNEGTLLVNGSILGDVVVASGATLGGSGLYGNQISGEGLVSVGNSPGIGTAASVNPSLGTDFVFEITGTMPAWGLPTASVNDVLRLTGATPFAANLGGSNEVAVLFSSIEQTTYLGGFYSDSLDFASALTTGNFTYWMVGSFGDVGNQRQFAVGSGGSLVTYSPLAAFDSGLEVSVAVVAQAADFGGGTVNGYSTQFIVVPEPTGLALAGLGAAAAAWGLRRRRQRQAPPA